MECKGLGEILTHLLVSKKWVLNQASPMLA
jgi:hypothetical protein